MVHGVTDIPSGELPLWVDYGTFTKSRILDSLIHENRSARGCGWDGSLYTWFGKRKVNRN